jgi:DNA-3-methyladenine glycosylase I
LKIQGAINNAQRFLEVQKARGSFDAYICRFVGGKPIQHRFRSLSELPDTSPDANALSKDLKQRGFKFVGSTIIYANMQATGMVNDHKVSCFRYKQVIGHSSKRNESPYFDWIQILKDSLARLAKCRL